LAGSNNSGGAAWRIPYPNPTWSCWVSLALAVTVSVLILAYPRMVATSISDLKQGLLSLLMWGVATGFVHGVGFVPRMTLWRIAFHPLLGWPVMGYGILMLFGVVE
jgi:cyd operon protein YbgE